MGLDLVDEGIEGRWDATDASFAVAETLLAADDPDVVEIVVGGLLEAVHHGASHVDGLADQFVDRLPTRCRSAWVALDERVILVEEWMRRTNQTLQMAEAAPAMVDPDMARLFRINYWRSPSGALVGVADMADHAADLEAMEQRGFS